MFHSLIQIVPREQHLAPILLATKRNAKWTNEDEQRLRDLKRIGVSIDDIAQDLRRTVAAVKKRWESLNKSNVNQSNESNRSTASSRRGGKRRRSDNNSMVSKSRQKWTDEDVQRLRRMKESGISYEEIGRVLHRSVKGVQNKWLNVNKFGVSFRFIVLSLKPSMLSPINCFCNELREETTPRLSGAGKGRKEHIDATTATVTPQRRARTMKILIWRLWRVMTVKRRKNLMKMKIRIRMKRLVGS